MDKELFKQLFNNDKESDTAFKYMFSKLEEDNYLVYEAWALVGFIDILDENIHLIEVEGFIVPFDEYKLIVNGDTEMNGDMLEFKHKGNLVGSLRNMPMLVIVEEDKQRMEIHNLLKAFSECNMSPFTFKIITGKKGYIAISEVFKEDDMLGTFMSDMFKRDK